MGLESVTVIWDLNESWPLGTDPRAEGDDHFRNVKTALKNTFQYGDLADRPAATLATKGRYYFAEDTGDLYINDGTAWQKISTEAAVTVPTGALSPYAGASSPSGWLLCDGSAVSRTTYTSLFALISTQYGSGDGSTTFNVPDLRGRTVIALDNMGGASADRITAAGADTRGGSGGQETVTLSSSNFPEHRHSFSDSFTTNSAGSHSHSVYISSDAVSSGTQRWMSGSNTGDGTRNTNSTGSHSHSGSVSGDTSYWGEASPTGVNVTPPWMALNYIIKT